MKISIVVPCYNARGKIETCISSLCSIDFPEEEFEVIFVDDFSSDGTFDYLQSVCMERRNWSVYRLEANSGSPSRPRNFGSMQAKGEYLLYLDCDDVIFPETLREHYSYAVSRNACIVRGYLMVDDGGESLRSLNTIANWNEDLSKSSKIKLMISSQSTTVVSLVKRSVIIENNIMWREDIRMGEDTLFLIAVLSSSKHIEYIDHPTFIYNKRASRQASSTQQYGQRELMNHLCVWTEAESLLRKVDISYYEIRLHVGLTAVFQALIFHGKADIDHGHFEKFSDFMQTVRGYIDVHRFEPHHIELINAIFAGNYDLFIQACKPRLLIAGYDLKFILPSIPALEAYFNIKFDGWKGHDVHDEQQSRKLLQWADYIWCEWLLGNAVWYSKNIREGQKLMIRMHRMELERNYGDLIDIKNVDIITAVSVLFFERLLQRFQNIPRKKVRLLSNYSCLGRRDSEIDSVRLFKLGAVGIVPSRKGLDSMLRILAALRKLDSRYSLDIFGHGPEHFSWITRDKKEMEFYNGCQSFIVENDLTGSVKYMGHCKMPDALTQQRVGFVLSTSLSGDFPGFESFHLAVLDGFSGGGQGVILRWDGCEYIYPSSMIFNTEDEIVDYISRMTVEQFYEASDVGRDLIASRYSQQSFVESVVSVFKE
ncbi:glycosyltransferase [Brucella sp. BE17]|uniref:glycosyltransferase n=1 Tax=Brucella sp. BE17 TaxID=3142977 RepID=UPI0031BA6B48